MKKFRVSLTQTLIIEFDDDRATEKSAAHIAEKVGACVVKSGMSKNMNGWFRVNGEPDAKADSIVEIDTKRKYD